jgi:hypothetical protein
MSSTGGGDDEAETAGTGALVINGRVETGVVGGIEAGVPGRGGWDEYWTDATG